MVLALISLLNIGFKASYADCSPFYYHQGSTHAFCLIYVDNILLTVSNNNHLQDVIRSLQAEFMVKDLGSLDYFLGVKMTSTNTSLLLKQSKYIQDLLTKAHM